jgi:hypothetical protein
VAPWLPIPTEQGDPKNGSQVLLTSHEPVALSRAARLTKLTKPVRRPYRVAVRFGVVAALGPACGKPRPRTEDGCEALSELVLRIPADEEARYA